MSRLYRALLCGAALCALPGLAAAAEDDAPHAISGVTVEGRAPDAADAPLSAQAVGHDEIARTINALTVEDTLKYLPNIFVRRRHIGDTQAPITTRTSGVGSSARSLIYADGVLLSALVGNNNATASPRWGMVSPEEVERVAVRYGPFSAAYPGNSVGAVVEITTRTPEAFEASAKAAATVQGFKAYGTKDDYAADQAGASLGDRRGPFAWRLSLDHLKSDGQPLSFVTVARPAAQSAAGAPTTGGIFDVNRTGAPVIVLGAGGIERQDVTNGKLKLSWDITPKLTASYLLGGFANDDDAAVASYLRDASGAPVYAGALNLGGYAVNVPGSAFAGGMYRLSERHWMQALKLSGAAAKAWRWEAIATLYDYATDEQRSPSALPAGLAGGPGSILDLSGTGWRTFDAKAVWSPEGQSLSFGLHHDRYVLGSDRYNTADWMGGPRGALAASSRGKTETDALFLEDAVRIAPKLDLTLGLRHERWRAFDGLNVLLSPASSTRQPALSAERTSPKASLAWAPAEGWRLAASVGQAYRFPTVSELYQAVTVGTQVFVPNPDLKPERALSSELSAERTWRGGRARMSLFTEDIDDALISQTAPIAPGSTTLAAFVQNVGHVRSRGAEAQVEATGVLLDGLDLSASLTWVDSEITEDAAFPAAVGKQTPQVPRLRWTAVATYRATDKLNLTAAARYSDRVYATLDNSDRIGHTWQGFEGYLVVDLRAQWAIDRHWTAAVGVDNALGRDYFLFHPFPQRSALVELKYAY